MLFRFDLAEYFLDLAMLINQESGAVNAHIGSPHELFLAERPVRFANRAIGICQEAKRQIVLLGEFFVPGFAVERNSQHLDAALFELGERIAERTGFFGASRRVVLRIKIENDFLAAQIFQADGLSLAVDRGKIRGFVTFF